MAIQPLPGLGSTGSNMWADTDMLPIGILYGRNSSFTTNETLSVVTAWSMWKSPLMFGGNLIEMENFTATILQNPEIFYPSQRGVNNSLLWLSETNGTMAWHAFDAHDSTIHYFGFWNLNATSALYMVYPLNTYWGITLCRIHDLVGRSDLSASSTSLKVSIPPHGVAFLQIDTCTLELSNSETIVIVASVLGIVLLVVLVLLVHSRFSAILELCGCKARKYKELSA